MKNMKEVLHEKLIYYLNEYNEGFKVLIVRTPFIVNNQLTNEKLHLIFVFFIKQKCNIFDISRQLIIKLIDNNYSIHLFL